MSRRRTRSAIALLGAFLCLAACAPTATARIVPAATATTPPAPSATPTPVMAPTPTNVPSGWQVLATTDFSIAYPPGSTVESSGADVPEPSYVIWAPAKQSSVTVTVIPQAGVPQDEITLYCSPESQGARRTTLANLPMTFQMSGLGNTVAVWRFVNARETLYLLAAGGITANPALQAQDTAIFATFRPDDATPWSC